MVGTRNLSRLFNSKKLFLIAHIYHGILEQIIQSNFSRQVARENKLSKGFCVSVVFDTFKSPSCLPETYPFLYYKVNIDKRKLAVHTRKTLSQLWSFKICRTRFLS